ncbi:MAG: STN domain-containing protein [Rhodanobacter sp.]
MVVARDVLALAVYAGLLVYSNVVHAESAYSGLADSALTDSGLMDSGVGTSGTRHSDVAEAFSQHRLLAMVSSVPDERASFDIPQQPLMGALRAYSEATGQAVLVDDALAAGLYASEVRGSFTPAEALRLLLKGTGLTARYASVNAFTLISMDKASSLPRSELVFRDDVDKAADAMATEVERYASGIQAAIEEVLCRSELTRPGGYRLAMQVWIDTAGAVERTHLLGSTGVQARDNDIVASMQHLMLSAPPPSMPQPITLLLLPKATGKAFQCHTPSASPR